MHEKQFMDKVSLGVYTIVHITKPSSANFFSKYFFTWKCCVQLQREKYPKNTFTKGAIYSFCKLADSLKQMFDQKMTWNWEKIGIHHDCISGNE